jgi:oxygen-independent coproporphyrinogen-3 oxidase
MTCSALAIYVHVPFCAQKCPYCDFNTYAVRDIPEREYTDALCCELSSFARDARFSGRKVSSLFFGGGTPSIFAPQSIARLVRAVGDNFGFCEGVEVTLECNPNDAESDKLIGFRDGGINRISFGVQSFRDDKLKLLGRDHTSLEAIKALEGAISVGFENLSLDLIFGVPGESLSALRRDIAQAIALPIKHISTYSLTIEPGTPFFQRQERGLLKLPADKDVADMLKVIPEILASEGFERYEISNYARGGLFKSRHNLVYWGGGDYLGCGAGAHSYVASRDSSGAISSAERWSNVASPDDYIRRSVGLERDRPGLLEQVCSWSERLGVADLIFEFFYLGLRLIEGVSRRGFFERFGCNVPSEIEGVLRDLEVEGFVVLEGDRIALTSSGVALADSVFERLLVK